MEQRRDFSHDDVVTRVVEAYQGVVNASVYWNSCWISKLDILPWEIIRIWVPYEGTNVCKWIFIRCIQSKVWFNFLYLQRCLELVMLRIRLLESAL